MDVYLVPTGRDGYELYCEVISAAPDSHATASASWFGRLTHSFRQAVAEGEREHADPPIQSPSRLRRLITRRLAEAVAEQRLLWNLRGKSEARLVHPDDVSAEEALARSRVLITADRDKHWKWSLINAALLTAAAPLTVIPGPNLLAYYFTFRTVGHYLSKRGAEQGLSRVNWSASPSAPLTALRAALALDPSARASQVAAVADALGLERLSRFVSGVANGRP